jgi:hypothetical protein
MTTNNRMMTPTPDSKTDLPPHDTTTTPPQQQKQEEEMSDAADAPIPPTAATTAPPQPSPSDAASTAATAEPNTAPAQPKEEEGEEAVTDAMDIHLLTLKECFVYAVPRLATATGYRAEDWGLAHPLVTGSLRCYRRGDDRLYLRIYASPPSVAAAEGGKGAAAPGGGAEGGNGGEGGGAVAAAARPSTPRLFAEAPIYLGKGPKGEAPPPLEASFTPVVDSSRYFVIKVCNGWRKGGMGGVFGCFFFSLVCVGWMVVVGCCWGWMLACSLWGGVGISYCQIL